MDERPGRDPLTREAAAFLLDLGVCPGGACPRAAGGCDPRCPALQAWVEDVSGG
jgi:hypothetical protein